jgi:histidinol dehydrogenase
MLQEAGMGSTSWIPFYHTGRAYIPSCDFWCMVSPDTARDLILPDILAEMQPMERSIFHLDGPQALRHLDLLLGIPSLKAVQWVFGAGNGPAGRWIDVYRKIIAAGKGVQVLADDAADALAVLRAVGPEGVWLQVGEPFENRRAAESFLNDVRSLSRTAGSHRSSAVA